MTKGYYNSGFVRFDNSIADFGDTSYPIANIGAVSVDSQFEGIIGTVASLVVVGLIAMAFGGVGVLIGLALMGLGIYLAFKGGSTEYRLDLRTSSGNSQAFKSKNKQEIEAIRKAILQAISDRK